MKVQKKIFCFALLLTLPFFAFSQSYDWEKVEIIEIAQKTFSQSYSAMDEDGNFYTSDNASYAGDLNSWTDGDYQKNNIFIRKYDSEFNLIWTKKIANSIPYKTNTSRPTASIWYDQGLLKVFITIRDSMYVNNQLYKTNCFDDAYCWKKVELQYDKSGNLLNTIWAEGSANFSFETVGDDHFDWYGLNISTPYAGFNIPDTCYLKFKDDSLTTYHYNSFLQKYSKGNDSLLWRIPAISIERLLTDGLGNVYVFETVSRWGWRTIKKIGADGSLIWERKIMATISPSLDLLSLTNAKIAKNGDIITLYKTFYNGNDRSVTLYDGNNYSYLSGLGKENFVIVVYKPNGDKRWARMSKSSGYEGLSGIESDEDANVYFTGYHYHQILDGKDTIVHIDYNNGSEILVISYDSLGNYRWSKSEGGSGKDAGGNIHLDSMGNIIVFGSVGSNPCVFGDIETSFSLGAKMFFAKLKKIPLSVPILENNINLSIYPNPTEGLLYLSFMEEDSYDVSVFNSLGEELIRKRFQGNDLQLDLSTLNAGSYFVVVKNSQNIQASQQVIITSKKK
ncbi:MAG: T9SS type A sorting domain-containing protein [Flavobacteriales bacterium]|jgi:hypothetical protein|nr:T9SS type A sorting domain-containing protein [Flavobacteriales bacterium]